MRTETVIAGLVLLLAAGCKPDAPQALTASAPEPVAVRAEAAERKMHLTTEDVVGTVRSKLHAVIEAKVSGRIQGMRAAPGDTVRAGDLLVQLEGSEVRARLEQALAQREQLKRDTERLRNLLVQNAVSRQEFETVESRYRVAVAAAEEAETMLGYMTVEAPFDGVITRKLADVGDLATPGRPLLEMDDPRALRLEADVPEGLIGRIVPGARLRVRSPAGRDDVQGTVSEISPAADAMSRTFRVKLDLPTVSGLRVGQFARVTIPIGDHEGIWVPETAVVIRGQMELVFVAKDGKAALRLVKTGKRIGDRVELVSGITAGERVVAEGAKTLRDGQRIEVRP